MRIEEISRKALQRLHTHNKLPTPSAYFVAFDEVLKSENLRKDSAEFKALDWREQWLKKFDKSLQPELKKAQSPEEFIDILSTILKDSKETQNLEHIEHIRELKKLNRLLLGCVSDIFSINAKQRFSFLFGIGGLNKVEGTKKLANYWQRFRDSGVHSSILRKLVRILAFILRTPTENGKVSKEALELSSMLLMHPENLVDVYLLERIENLLGIKEIQGVAFKDEMTQRCIVIFKLNHLQFVEKKADFDKDKAINKAMEILKTICLEALEEATLVGHYQNGFAVMIREQKTLVLDKISPITARLQTQKFSYQGVLFSFSFEAEVLEYGDFRSLEELNHTLREKLHYSQVSIESKDSLDAIS